MLGEPTFADAILDRIVHNAYRLELDGPSMRKLKANEQAQSESRMAAKHAARSAGAPLPKSAKGGPG
jgi:IstB-like ATP binding protein